MPPMMEKLAIVDDDIVELIAFLEVSFSVFECFVTFLETGVNSR